MGLMQDGKAFMRWKSYYGKRSVPLSNLQMGGLIRAARKKLGLSPADFAKMTGMSRYTVYALENGRNEFCPSTLHKMTTALLTRAASPIVVCQEASKSPIENNAPAGEPQRVMNAPPPKEYRRFVQGWKVPKPEKSSDGSAVSHLNVEVGNRVRAVRKMLDLSIANLSRMTGIRPSQLFCLERGMQGFGPYRLRKIANILGVKVVFLISGKRRISAASVVTTRGSCGPRMPKELVDVLHSRVYREFLMRCVEICMHDEATFNKLRTIARKCKLGRRC